MQGKQATQKPGGTGIDGWEALGSCRGKKCLENHISLKCRGRLGTQCNVKSRRCEGRGAAERGTHRFVSPNAPPAVETKPGCSPDARRGAGTTPGTAPVLPWHRSFCTSLPWRFFCHNFARSLANPVQTPGPPGGSPRPPPFTLPACYFHLPSPLAFLLLAAGPASPPHPPGAFRGARTF